MKLQFFDQAILRRYCQHLCVLRLWQMVYVSKPFLRNLAPLNYTPGNPEKTLSFSKKREKYCSVTEIYRTFHGFCTLCPPTLLNFSLRHCLKGISLYLLLFEDVSINFNVGLLATNIYPSAMICLNDRAILNNFAMARTFGFFY